MQLGAHAGLKRNLVEPHGYTNPVAPWAQNPRQARPLAVEQTYTYQGKPSIPI